MSHETKIIDMLYLELSQFTSATTAKEIELEHQLNAARKVIEAARAEDSDAFYAALAEWDEGVA